MEPKGKLNDREPARREREIPGGPVSLSVGKHVVKRCLTGKRNRDLCLK